MAVINVFGMMLQDIQLIIILEVLLGSLFLIGWFIYNKNRFKACIVEPYLNSWKIIKEYRISNDVQTFHKKIGGTEREFKKDFTSSIIDKNNKPIIYYNVTNSQPVKPITGITTKVESSAFRVFVKAEQIKHLGEKLGAGNILIWLIVGLIIALVIVSVWAIYNQNMMNQQILELTKQLANATKTTQNNGGVVVIP